MNPLVPPKEYGPAGVKSLVVAAADRVNWPLIGLVAIGALLVVNVMMYVRTKAQRS